MTGPSDTQVNYTVKEPEDVSLYGANIEDSVVGTWFARLGVLAVLIGAAFGYRYAVDQGWIGPAGRVLLGVLVGIGFLVGGHSARDRKWYPVASAMSGGGIAILYLSTLAALVRFELITPPTALMALTSIALLSAVLSIRYDSLSLSVIATVGAFANPFLISSGEPNATAALTYAVAIDVGIVYLAYAGKWNVLNKIALIGSALIFVTVGPGTVDGVGFASVMWIIFTCVPFLQVLSDRTRRVMVEAGMLVTVSGLYFAAGMHLLRGDSSVSRGVFTVCLGLACAGFAAIAHTDDRTRPLLRDVMAAQAIAWLTLAGPIALNGLTVPLVWSVEGALLAWLGSRIADDRVIALSVVFLGAGLVGAVDHIASYRPDALFLTGGGAVAAGHLVAFFSVAWLVSRRASEKGDIHPFVGVGLMTMVTLLSIVWLSREASFEVLRNSGPESELAAVQFAYSALWSVIAALLLAGGILKKVPWARYFGVALFGVVIAKMLTVDVWQLSVLYRMLVFVGLGGLLLACSLMYNQFRDAISAKT
ncbi:MAG: hypothetical protein QOG54_1325 [Actinomycetota bacterium]|jgi:uncharacterized membrane protein|nr:hypothetical protein [Actinomycetota bacterium]